VALLYDKWETFAFDVISGRIIYLDEEVMLPVVKDETRRKYIAKVAKKKKKILRQISENLSHFHRVKLQFLPI